MRHGPDAPVPGIGVLPPAGQRSTGGNIARAMASRAVRLLLATAASIMIARALQPEGRGVYAVLVATVTMTMVLGHLSIERAQISLWVDQQNRSGLTSNAAVLGVVLGIPAALITFVMATRFDVPTSSPLIVVVLIAVPLGAAGINLKGIALLRSRLEIVNRCTLAAALAQSVPLLVLAAMGGLTLSGVVVCWTVSMVVPFVILFVALRPSLRWDPRLARRQLTLGGLYHPGRVAAHLLMTIDVLLLGGLDSASAAGIYTVAVTVLSLTSISTDAVAHVALARQVEGDLRHAESVTAHLLRLNILISAGITGVLALSSPILIPLVYGQSFADSVLPLLLLAPGAVALAVIRLIEQHFARLSRAISMTMINTPALMINIALNLVMIPWWGVTGAALASTTTYVALAIVQSTWFIRSTAMPVTALLPGRAEVRSVLRSAAAVLLSWSRRVRRARQ
jgi:O-antigen/teichoic acid export membrane protein